MADDDREARMALCCVVEPADTRLWERLAHQTPVEVWASVRASREDGAWVRRAASLDLAGVQRSTQRHGLRFVVPGDEEWPDQVGDLAQGEPVSTFGGAPLGLWVRGAGHLAALTRDAVAIVGSRASTAYGERVSADFGAGLAGRGKTVVSGAAFGIDAAAHRGALAAEGRTLAVLARGLDDVYPRAHASLIERIAEDGVVVSELPPGEVPSRRRFLTRNRLIAALASGVIIVEAGARSGARNTASWASACGRHVMAVPGPVTSAQSYTPHRLVREGEATLVTTVDEVCEMVAPMGESLVLKQSQPRLFDQLQPDQAAAYEALPSRGSRDTGEVALRSGLTLPRALVALESLRSRGFVTAAADGGWRLGPVQDRPMLSADQQADSRQG